MQILKCSLGQNPSRGNFTDETFIFSQAEPQWEEYRKRLQDQKDWNEESEHLLTKIHQREMDLVKGDLQKEMDEKAAIEQKAQESEGYADWLADLVVETVNHLAIWTILDPARWQIAKKSLSPEVSRMVEKVTGRRTADLPPKMGYAPA